MFESKNECLIKNLKGFDFKILFLTFKITFWRKKSFFHKNSFDHKSYDFLSIWYVNTTDRLGISLRIFLKNYFKSIEKMFFHKCHFLHKTLLIITRTISYQFETLIQRIDAEFHCGSFLEKIFKQYSKNKFFSNNSFFTKKRPLREPWATGKSFFN